MAPIWLLSLTLRAAAPWTVQAQPLIEAPWSVDEVASFDGDWVGITATHPGGHAVFVSQPPRPAEPVLALEARIARGMGFAVLVDHGDEHLAYRIRSSPSPAASKVATLPAAPTTLACAHDAEVCAWVVGRTLVVQKGVTQTSLS